MPLNLRASKKVRDFDLAVSYRIHERRNKLIDARNVFSNQGRLETRFGSSRYNSTTLGGSILSLSSFQKSDASNYTIAKVGTSLYSVAISGAHTEIKSGLGATTKHRGVTFNNRHIISIEGDGLFSWDGTIFSQLGQAAPATLTATLASGGSLSDATSYQAAVTFYASSIGMESNYQTSAITAVAGGNLTLDLSAIPATAPNGFVDKIRIYLKNTTTNSSFLFIAELAIGTTTYSITANSTSAVVAPENNGPPLAGGGKFMGIFNSKLVHAGSTSFPNDVFFSEQYLPDAYNPNDSQVVLTIPGQGGITGLAVGMFGDSYLDPFVCIFKRRSIHIYSELGGNPKSVIISNEVGCVSHDTIQVKNGAVYFLSDEGWRAIVDGRLVRNSEGEAITLGNGDIDDIFKSPGYIYEINRAQMTNAFSVYYPTLDQYMTWISEGSNNAFTKVYVYEYNSVGFKVFEFSSVATCATIGESATSRPVVLFGTSGGFILQHSIVERRSDEDSEGTEVSIPAFAVLPWYPNEEGDFDATYNFRELVLKAIVSANALTVKSFIDFDLSDQIDYSYTFTDPNSGFILDLSLLDVGVFGDERTIKSSRADINRTALSMAIGFYQDVIGGNIGLVAAQLDLSKNGNSND